jgi:hypothetical protein
LNLYTKNGKPLQVHGDIVYSRSGIPVGRISGEKVFGPNGRYVGSIDGDRLVYRSTESAEISSSFSVGRIGGTGAGSIGGSGIWGDEPDIPG